MFLTPAANLEGEDEGIRFVFRARGRV